MQAPMLYVLDKMAEVAMFQQVSLGMLLAMVLTSPKKELHIMLNSDTDMCAKNKCKPQLVRVELL